ncbi:SPOR domain-containing protein [Dyella marensis]|uniref:Sporulation related domain-containing protein n=1 Tax=Dyella marensis TaxID=500610 RepID=A0A1I1XDD8_9GAMM|nr:MULTISPECIES: SPOR domain-containing protein [Dyella]SFE05424.1 Sporulation related domain-containing protein [Dyella marensis]
MFAKLGLILLILLFGALAFAGGMMAPDGWRAPMQEIAARWRDRPAIVLPHVPAPSASTAAPAAAASAVSTHALLVTSDVAAAAPAAGQPAYALQLGQFIDAGDADALERQAQGLGLPLQRIAAIDPDHAAWTVLAAGRFPSPAAAQNEMPRVQAVLKLASTPVIRLPAGKPSS